MTATEMRYHGGHGGRLRTRISIKKSSRDLRLLTVTTVVEQFVVMYRNVRGTTTRINVASDRRAGARGRPRVR